MVPARTVRAMLLVAPLLFASIQAVQAPAATTVPAAKQQILKVNAGPAPRISTDAKAKYPLCGVQFTYTLLPDQTIQFFTFGWPSYIAMDWSVMDDTYDPGQADVSLTNVATEGDETTSASNVTYWLTVTNFRSFNEKIEGRYCYLQKTVL